MLNGECLEWKGATRGGRFNQYGNYRGRMAHRVAWELVHGEIPDGKFVLHHCDNPKCVNVQHLFIGTLSDNARDMVDKGRHGMARLNWESVEQIRKLLADGESQKALSQRFGVSVGHICCIEKRK